MSTPDPKTTKKPDPDDALRLLAATRLAKYLDRGDEFLEECGKLARETGGDRLGPLAAAARLMSSNAKIAQVLAQVARVERRSRTVVERIAPPDPRRAELISKKVKEGVGAEIKLRMVKRMNELVEQSIRARTGETQERDRVAELLKHYDETIQHIREEIQEIDDADPTEE